MTLKRFRELVFAEFGPDLAKATPANVNEFFARLEQEDFRLTSPGVLDLDEPTASYEGIIKGFLADSLRQEPAAAVLHLWKFACQLAFGMVEQHEIRRLERLSGPDS
jgi:hypothetical protein